VSKQQGTKKKTAEGTIPPGADYLRDAAWLSQQRQALLAERGRYTNSAERLAAEAAELMADREPGDVQFDEESGEGDTIAVERDRDLALSAAARQAVSDIDAALSRLDNHTYGLCIVGGDAIPKERLEAIPEAAVCVQHKTSMF
jgi:RNA polymerase-binding transcription factor DksA